MQIYTVTLNPGAASATTVAASQSPGAGAITLAATASNIDAGNGRIVSLVSGGNDSGITFTITGTNANGGIISESVVGGNIATVVSTKFYASVTSITHTGSVAGTFSSGIVGTTLSAASRLVPINYYARTAAQIVVEITGTANFTVKETFDPILTGTPTTDNAVLFPITALTAKAANTFGTVDVGASGVILIVNSYSTGATLTMRINTPSNSNGG